MRKWPERHQLFLIKLSNFLIFLMRCVIFYLFIFFFLFFFLFYFYFFVQLKFDTDPDAEVPQWIGLKCAFGDDGAQTEMFRRSWPVIECVPPHYEPGVSRLEYSCHGERVDKTTTFERLMMRFGSGKSSSLAVKFVVGVLHQWSLYFFFLWFRKIHSKIREKIFQNVPLLLLLLVRQKLLWKMKKLLMFQNVPLLLLVRQKLMWKMKKLLMWMMKKLLMGLIKLWRWSMVSPSMMVNQMSNGTPPFVIFVFFFCFFSSCRLCLTGNRDSSTWIGSCLLGILAFNFWTGRTMVLSTIRKSIAELLVKILGSQATRRDERHTIGQSS